MKRSKTIRFICGVTESDTLLIVFSLRDYEVSRDAASTCVLVNVREPFIPIFTGWRDVIAGVWVPIRIERIYHNNFSKEVPSKKPDCCYDSREILAIEYIYSEENHEGNVIVC